jgi:hypothetical protein
LKLPSYTNDAAFLLLPEQLQSQFCDKFASVMSESLVPIFLPSVHTLAFNLVEMLVYPSRMNMIAFFLLVLNHVTSCKLKSFNGEDKNNKQNF